MLIATHQGDPSPHLGWLLFDEKFFFPPSPRYKHCLPANTCCNTLCFDKTAELPQIVFMPRITVGALFPQGGLLYKLFVQRATPVKSADPLGSGSTVLRAMCIISAASILGQRETVLGSRVYSLH